MNVNFTLNSQMSALSLRDNDNILSNGESSSSQDEIHEAPEQNSPAEISAAERFYNIPELMTMALGLSLNVLRQEQIKDRLTDFEGFNSFSLKRLLSTTEEYAVTAQQAYSRELTHIHFYKTSYKRKFTAKLHDDLLIGVKKIINSMKHLSWSLDASSRNDRVLLNGKDIQDRIIDKKFFILLEATQQHRFVKTLNIEALGTNTYPHEIPVDDLINKISLAIKNPFVIDESQTPPRLRDGRVSLTLINNGFISSHMEILRRGLNRNISKLTIRSNRIKEEGVRQLAEGLQNTSISILALDGVAEGDTWFLPLRGKVPPTLEALSLESNRITKQGIRNLEEILTPNIRSISLSRNGLTSWDIDNRRADKEIVDDVFKLMKDQRLQILSLCGNDFKKTAFSKLLERVAQTEIMYLDLRGNSNLENPTQSKINTRGEQIEIQASAAKNYQGSRFSQILESYNIV